jgi:hypothetical protein
MLWRDKCDTYMLTNIHDAPAEGNVCNGNGKAIKPQIVADYSRHMGFVDRETEWPITTPSACGR